MTTKRSRPAEYYVAWRARNPEKARAATAAWRARNLETARAADVEYSRKYAAENKVKISAQKADYYRRNRKRLLAKSAERREQKNKQEFYFKNIERRFGLTEERFAALLKSQSGRCAICDEIFVFGEGRRKTANVDHFHDSGVVRGLLCGGCNTGIGNLRDSPELLIRAAIYLERYK